MRAPSTGNGASHSPGWLHHWERSTDGAWFGAVDYSIPLRDDFRPAKHITLGLVPADALRPRDRHRDADAHDTLRGPERPPGT